MIKRKRTDKSKYKHQSTGDYCTCAAYVAEIMCMKNAEYQNKGSLPYKFWNVKPWGWTFKRQLLLANKLLKIYDETAVVKAINSDEFKRIFSLSNARAENIIKKYQAIVDTQNANLEKVEPITIKPQEDIIERKTTYGKKSLLSKLRSIESNGEKIE